MSRIIPPVLLAFGILSACRSGKELQTAQAEISRLKNDLSQLNQQHVADEQLINELKRSNEINSADAAEYRAAKELLRQKREKLDRELAARGTSLEEMKANAQDAVRKFQVLGCAVSYENGRFHIVVPDEYSFQPGEVSVSAKGREALNVVAQVMYDNPNVSTVIVGHTDTLSVHNKYDNWTISTARANAVVRVLQDVYNINPKRLMAAGSSMYHPVASNSTEEGRQKNRRIEFYINPHFDRIWNLLEE